MPGGLVGLLDDVAALAKLAAASIDDVGAAGRPSGKAAGASSSARSEPWADFGRVSRQADNYAPYARRRRAKTQVGTAFSPVYLVMSRSSVQIRPRAPKPSDQRKTVARRFGTPSHSARFASASALTVGSDRLHRVTSALTA
jgi:hypothetical protein